MAIKGRAGYVLRHEGRYIVAIIAAAAIGLFLALSVSGCATMQAPITVPQTQQETIYSLRMQFSALVNTAADMRQAGAVTDEMYYRLDSVFQKARAAFGVADVALLQGVTAEDQIASIQRLLLEVRQLLGGTSTGQPK